MINLREVVSKDDAPAARPAGVVTLTFEERRRSRLLVRLDDGREAALLLPRGTVLVDGQLLRADGDVGVVMVRAAAETLSVARASDPHLIARAAYHLGNRHTPVQVGAGWLRLAADGVLADMLRGLGAAVTPIRASFEPEAGAYAAGHHAHSGEAKHAGIIHDFAARGTHGG